MLDERVDSTAVVAEVAARFGIAPVCARRFGGEAADLDLDLNAPRPLAVTRLLVSCAGADADAWWGTPVHARIVALVALGELVGPIIETRMECVCGELSVVSITASELGAFARERIGATSTIDVDGVRVRIPTGRDQLRWLVARTDQGIVRTVISSLVEDDREIDDAHIAAIDRALADADPLVDFRVESACPACGTAMTSDVDLEALALFRLRRAQRTMIEQVDALARAYHWTERQIVGLPAWRREEYLALIGSPRA